MKTCALVLAGMLVAAGLSTFCSAEDALNLPSVMVRGPASTGQFAPGPAATVPVAAGQATAGPVAPASGVREAPAWVAPMGSPQPMGSDAPLVAAQPTGSAAPGGGWPPQGDLRSGQGAGSGDPRTTGGDSRATPDSHITPDPRATGGDPHITSDSRGTETNLGDLRTTTPQGLPDVSDARPLTAPGEVAVGVPPLGSVPSAEDGKLVLPNPPATETPPSGVEQAGHEAELPPPPNYRGQGNAGVPNTFSTNGNALTPVTNPPSATDAATQAAAHAAADLWKTSVSSVSRNSGSGFVPLRYYLEHCSEAQRGVVAQAYWRLIRALSSYNWAIDEQQKLEQTVPGRNSAEGPMLAAARGAAAARVTEARLEVDGARNALEGIAPQLVALTNPALSADNPLVGPYHTFYNQIFASRPNPRAKQIDRSLPIRQEAINNWVTTVHSAASAVHYAEQAHAKGEVDLRTLLACHDTLREQRRKFLDAVLQYNLEIAEYAAMAAPAGTSAEKFAGMLIPAKQPERMTAVPSRPSLPLGAGGQRQTSAGQPTGPTRQLPWGDGWVSSSGQTQQVPQARWGSMGNGSGAGSRGATGEWQNPPAAQSSAPPPAEVNSVPQKLDPFANGGGGPRYGTQR